MSKKRTYDDLNDKEAVNLGLQVFIAAIFFILMLINA
jgi:hypothetical protein